MTERLTKEREAEIRRDLRLVDSLRDALAEIDALRAELEFERDCLEAAKRSGKELVEEKRRLKAEFAKALEQLDLTSDHRRIAQAREQERAAVVTAEDRGANKTFTFVLALLESRRRDYCAGAAEAKEQGLEAEHRRCNAAANALEAVCDAVSKMRGQLVREGTSND